MQQRQGFFIQLISIFSLLLVQSSLGQNDSYNCGLGCSSCISTDQCQTCNEEFMYNENGKECKYNKCDDSLLALKDEQTNKYSCVAICEENQIANYSQNTCNPIYQCSSSYSTVQFNSKISMNNLGQYQNKFIVLIYSNFYNLFSLSNGQFIDTFSFKPTSTKPILINQMLFSIDFLSSTVSLLDLESGTVQIVFKAVKGQLTSESIITILDDNISAITSIDESSQTYYISFFSFTSSALIDDVLELEESSNLIKILPGNVVMILSNNYNQLNLMKIMYNKNQFSLFQILQPNLMCSSIESFQSITQFVQIRDNQFIFSSSTLTNLFYFDDKSSNCVSLDSINTFQTIGRAIIQQPLIFIQRLKAIELYSPDFLLLASTSLENQIKDFQFYYFQQEQKSLVYILDSANNLQIFSINYSNSNLQFLAIQSIQINIVNPIGLLISYDSQNTASPLVLIYNYDCQVISANDYRTLFILQSFQTDYASNKSKIISLNQSSNEKYVVSTSDDGQSIVWSLNSRYRGTISLQFDKITDNCISSSLFIDRYIIINCTTQFIIYDVIKPFVQKNIKKEIQTASSGVSLNSQYLIINKDSCLIKYDNLINEVFRDCSSTYNSLSTLFLQEDNYLIFISGRSIQQVDTNQLQNPFPQVSQYLHSSDIVQIKFRIYSNQSVKCVFSDTTLHLTILATDLTVESTLFISFISKIVDFNFPSNIDNEDYLILGILSDVQASRRYRIYFLPKINPDIIFIQSFGLLSNILSVIYNTDSSGNKYYHITPLMPLSYVTLIYPIIFNTSTYYFQFGQYPIVYYESYSSDIVTKGQYGTHNYMAMISGYLGYTSLYKQTYKEVHSSAINQPVQRIHQNLRLDRYFIISLNVFVYNIHTDKFEEEITFTDQINSVKSYVFNYRLRMILFLKDKEIIVKNYSLSQLFRKQDTNSLFGAFISDEIGKIIVIGRGLQVYSLSLQLEQVLFPNSDITKCIFTTSKYICKQDSFKIVILDPFKLNVILTFEVSNIPSTFTISFDETYQRIFAYDKILQYYDISGIFKGQINNSTQPIFELNLYGERLVSINIGGGFIYDRNSLKFLAQFFTPTAGVLRKTVYIPKVNMMVYFTNSIRYGQVMFYSLRTLNDVGQFTSNSWSINGEVVDIYLDPEINELLYIDTLGNMGNIQYLSNISANNVHSLEFLFRLQSPTALDVHFQTNSILAANEGHVYRVNYACLTNQHQRYFRQLTSLSIQVKFKGISYFLIVDKTNIIYQYYKFELVYLTYYNEKVLDIQIVDQESQLVGIIFKQKTIVYLPSLLADGTVQLDQQQIISKYYHKQYLCSDTFFTYDQKFVEYDFKNNKELFAFQLTQQQDLINSYVCIPKEQKIIIGFFSGQVLVYYKQSKIMKEITTPQLAVDQIIKIIYTTTCIYAYQRSGNLLLLYEDPSKTSTTVQQTSYIQGQTNIEFSSATLDDIHQRFYITFQDQHILYVMDSNNFNVINHLSYSNDEYNRLHVGSNILILYSVFQLNIYTRDTMEFLYSIIRNNRYDTIDEIYLIDDTYLTVTFITKVEVYILDNANFSFKQIDSISTSFPKLLIHNFKNNEQDLPILQLIFFSKDAVFERYYSISLIQSGQKQCSFKFSSQRSLDTEHQLKTVYQADSQIHYSLFFEIGDSLEVFNKIKQAQIQLSINPLQKSSDCSNLLNLKANSFLSLQNDIMIKCFSFNFNEKGFYEFNEESKKVVFEDISISNQNISDVKIHLTNQESIIFQNIQMSSITSEPSPNSNIEEGTTSPQKQYFILIENCDTLNIYRLKIDNINLSDQNPIFFIRNVKQVLIKDSSIKKSRFNQIFKFEAVQNIQINGLEVSENNGYFTDNVSFAIQYLIDISGSRFIELIGINVKQNTNINFLYSSNVQHQDDMVITLSTDTINLNTMFIIGNIFTPNFLAVKGEESSMFYLSNSNININGLQYEGNQANLSIEANKNTSIKLSDFKNNLGTNGGALRVQNLENSLIIDSCQFLNNVASGSGGGIYLQNVKKLQIGDGVTVQFNQSLIGGGLRYVFKREVSQSYLNNNYQISSNSNISLNVAKIYGDNIVSYPSKLKFKIQTETNTVISQVLESNQLSRGLQSVALNLNQFQSGGFMNITMQFLDSDEKFVDISIEDYNNQVYPKSILEELQQIHFSIMASYKDRNQIQLSDSSLVNIQCYDKQKSGFFKQDLQLSGLPSNFNMINVIYQSSNSEIPKIFQIGVAFRNCMTGEIFKKLTKDIIQCYQCPNGFYSLSEVNNYSTNIQSMMQNNQSLIDDIICKKCPDSALQCSKNLISLKNGYWRASNQTEEIFQCSNNEEVCIPENQENKQGCAEGYIGPLCDFCDTEGVLWQNRYTQSVREYHCSECSQYIVQIIYIIIILLVILFYIVVQVIMFMNSYIHYQVCYYLRMVHILPISVSSLRDQSSFYMKILINFLQISSIILHIKFKLFPSIIVVGPSILGNAMGNVTVDINCVYPKEFISEFGTGRLRQITQSFLPPLFLMFLIVIFGFLEKYNIQQAGKYHKYTLFNFLIMFFQPDSLNLFSKSLTCRKIGSINVFTYDTLFNCDDSGYKNFQNYFTIPNLLFWILFPLIPLYSLYQKRKNLNWCSVKLKYGYFYTEFKPQFFYWEFVRIYVKVVIVLLYTFLAENNRINIILINLIITLYITAVIYWNPFQRINLKKLEISSFLVLIILSVLQGLNDEVKNISFELFFVFFNYLFISYTVYIIIYQKISSPFNILGKCTKFCLKRVFSQDLYEKYSLQKMTSFNCYIRWKKIRSNLNVLTQLKAIDIIDLKKISNPDGVNTEGRGNKSLSMQQHSFHSLQEKLKTNISCNLQISQIGMQEYFQKTPEFKLAINNLKNRGRGSNFLKGYASSMLKKSQEEQASSTLNSQIQLLNQKSSSKQLQQNDQGSPCQSALVHPNHTYIDKISDISSQTNDDDFEQFQEVSSYITPKAEVIISTYQSHSEKKWPAKIIVKQ